MTLLVKNEIDIIKENIDFHLGRGIDLLIVTDNSSTDGTREILSEYQGWSEIVVIDEPGDDHAQFRWVTRMALMAAQDYGADWIINNDADEFWYHSSDDLEAVLDQGNSHVVDCERRNMVYGYNSADATAAWFRRIIYRPDAPSRAPKMANFLTSPLASPHYMCLLPSKAALRAQGLKGVHQGNHGADFASPVEARHGDIVIYHFPVRSRSQFETKIRQGGSAYARNTELPISSGWHWRRWLATIEREGVEAALSEALPSQADIVSGLADGSIVIDRTMSEKLGTLSAT